MTQLSFRVYWLAIKDDAKYEHVSPKRKEIQILQILIEKTKSDTMAKAQDQGSQSMKGQADVSLYVGSLTKDHPLEQVLGNSSKPVQTRRQLDTDLEMCMFALTMSTSKPKNIKEAMAETHYMKRNGEEELSSI
ncbi:hypothetical protein Tco_1133194 [Tanacetum coccineum]